MKTDLTAPPALPPFDQVGDLIQLANTIYPDGYIGYLWDAKRQKPVDKGGDTLALFLTRELYDTFDAAVSAPEHMEEAIRAVTMARNEMNDLIDGIGQHLIDYLAGMFLFWVVREDEPVNAEVFQAWTRCGQMPKRLRHHDGAVRLRLQDLLPGWEVKEPDPERVQKVLEKLVEDLKLRVAGEVPPTTT